MEVAAVAAREPARAKRFAARYGIPTVHVDYARLLDDPALDAVYIPLPNSLHAAWTLRALTAGKHVLCEKPLAANAEDAQRMVETAVSQKRVLIEAFHYRYHPLAARLKEIVDSGELGQIRHVAAQFCIPFLPPNSIQFRYDLAGGAAMDVGCYAVHLLRHLLGAEPEVTHAEARLIRPQVDRWMRAQLRFSEECSGEITCALLSARLLRLTAAVTGTAGALSVVFPFLPHYFHWITVRTRSGQRRERVDGDTSYFHQLQAFVHCCETGASPITGGSDAIANQHVIDAMYTAAGLARRESQRKE